LRGSNEAFEPKNGASRAVAVGVHSNLVELPLGTREPVRLHLVLTTGDVVDFVGSGIEVDVTGAPVFVEDLPADLDPDSCWYESLSLALATAGTSSGSLRSRILSGRHFTERGLLEPG
jgi:hypothetical protein